MPQDLGLLALANWNRPYALEQNQAQPEPSTVQKLEAMKNALIEHTKASPLGQALQGNYQSALAGMAQGLNNGLGGVSGPSRSALRDALGLSDPNKTINSALGFMGSVGESGNLGQRLTRGDVRPLAESLADQLRSLGFDSKIEHWSNRAGNSSYLTVTDPVTNMRFGQIRVSDHSTGPFRYQDYHHVITDSDVPMIVERMKNLRVQYDTPARRAEIAAAKQAQAQAEANAIQMRLRSAAKKIAKGKGLTNSESEAVRANNVTDEMSDITENNARFAK